MEYNKHSITPMDTKEYLTKNKIPQLFECLMTGLMYHRPNDYLSYLQECLMKVKRQGLDGLQWNLFLGPKAHTPPPVAIKKGEEKLTKYQPLPGVDSIKVRIQPNASIICVLAGPGVDKSSFSVKLIKHYPSFVHISMGELLRNRAKLETKNKGSKWLNSVKQINSGELLPHEMVMESLIWNLNQHADAPGFIIDGFPRTSQQYEDFKNQVSLDNIACVLLIDASEDFCKQKLITRGQVDDFWKDHENRAIDTRICLFKLQTLPACKLVDADGKLRVVDGEIKPDHILRDIRTVCEYVLSGKVTGPATRPTPGTTLEKSIERSSYGTTCPGQPPVFDIPRIVPKFADGGRVGDLPICPIILLFGGPGSGRTSQAESLCQKLPGLTHFNLTEFLRNRVLSQLDEDSTKDWDVVARRVHSSDPPMEKDRLIPEYWNIQVDVLRQEFKNIAENARAVVIEGFPNDEDQLNVFNQHVGGVDLAILLDCEETTLQRRLLDRYNKLAKNEDEEIVSLHRVLFFKHCTLPVVRHYDERSLLVTIPADREESLVLNDVVTVVEYFLGKQEAQGNNSALVNPSIHSKLLAEGDTTNSISVDDQTSLKSVEEPEIIAEHKEHRQSMNSISLDPPAEDDHSRIDCPALLKVIFVTGNPCCGKTTQCGNIVSHFGYKYCAADKSRFDPLSAIETLQYVRTQEDVASNGFVMDGFNPTPKEMKSIASEFSAKCIKIDILKKENDQTGSEARHEVISSPRQSNKHELQSTSSVESDDSHVQCFTVNASGSVDETFETIRNILENV